ncbi:MAG: energy transducer TonB, partial [Bacteroidales bacterium]|nr:energy transducer TonB [Bacteroidales bacterium]
MDKRKTPKADLESKRSLYMQTGLVIVLALTLLAFEWKTYERAEYDLGQRQDQEVMEEVIVNTKQEVKPPPPKPPPQTTILNIVEDDVEVDMDIE